MRAIALATLAVTAFLLTACGKQQPSEIRVGGLAPAGTAADRYWQAFASGLAPPNRAVLLTRGELGSDEQILAALRRGRIQLAVNGAHALAGVTPEFALLSAPYLFEDEAHVDAAAHGALEAELAAQLRKQGIRLLALLPMGHHNVYSRRGAIAGPESLARLRLRQPTDPASAAFARALGADLVPLPASEIVTALQTGLVDAGTTVTLNYLWTGIADYAPDLTLTRHAYLFNALIANLAWWDALESAQRAAICAALPSAVEFTRAMRVAERADLERAVASKRVRLHELAPEALAGWRQAADASWPRLLAELGVQSPAMFERLRSNETAAATDARNAPRLFGCEVATAQAASR